MNKLTLNNKTIFVFDLHGVIFELCSFKVLKEVFKCPYKLKLLSIIFYPKVIIKTFYLLKKGAIAEETLLSLANKFPQFESLLNTGFNIINAQKPIWKTIEIIRNLKASGNKVYIFSNIGEKSMKIMQEKFPDIFGYFDGVLAATKEDNYLKKPDTKSFEKYLTTFNQKRENIIFIDDRIKNINSALSVNIPAILYKNPKQLNKELERIKLY